MAASPDSFLKYFLRPCPMLLLAFLSSNASSMNLDGKGHFGLRGKMETAPMGGQGIGKAQGIEESVFLEGELRFNDRSSFFLDFNLFDRPHYLGDDFNGRYCANRSESTPDAQDSSCYPNTREPSYLPYALRADQAYVRYGFDYFIFEGGRRGRNWGMGLFLDDGSKPFSKAASIYDGLTFSVNRQKSQTFGFAVGVDKIAEHGATLGSGVGKKNDIFNDGDDLEQIFLAFEYDDSLTNSPGSLAKKVGIYTSRFFPSSAVSAGGSDTNLGFLDLSLELQYASLLFQNEVLISYGSSADPNGMYLGGARIDDGSFARNDFSSLGFAAKLEWAISHSGGIIGPKSFAQGDLIRHLLFANYAYAPGNSDGYYSYRNDLAGNTDAEKTRVLGISKRSKGSKATAFHPNYRPALILFNEGNELGSYLVDGVYDPNRMMNAQIISLGYRYENLQIGTFSTQLSYGSMIEGMPSEVVSYYKSEAVKQSIKSQNGATPVGLFGKGLGFELDLEYKMRVNQDVDWSVALGTLIPGKGLQTNYNNRSEYDYLLQTDLVFKF